MKKFINKLVVSLFALLAPLALAQTSGLPSPTTSPFVNSTAATALFANLTGCATSGFVFVAASGTCVSQTAGTPYPSGSGIPIVSSGTSWGTTVAAPAGTVVGTSDVQTLTNKSISVSQITGFTFPGSGVGVGTSDTQTLTNKSIAGSEINSGTLIPSVQASSETVTFSTTPTFSTSTGYSTITLTAAITTFTMGSGAAGQEKVLTFCQNGTGGFGVTPPTNVHGFMTIGLVASKCNSQNFFYDTVQSAWLSNSPGVINE
jgi:hypothetical protein